MKQKLILFYVVMLMFSLSVQSQDDGDVKLTSIAEIRAVFELSDVGFYPEIVNEPSNALKYKGDKKIAANIGAYAADLLYVVATSDQSKIVEQYGAILELSQNFGITNDLLPVILKRYEDGNATVSEVFDMMQKALDDSEKNLTLEDKLEYFTYHTYGNYIEKLYVVSSIIDRPKKADIPEEAELTLKRNLIKFVSNQDEKLQILIDLLSPYTDKADDVVDIKEIVTLKKMYETTKAKRTELTKLGPKEFYEDKDVKAIIKQIKKIRTRLVKV